MIKSKAEYREYVLADEKNYFRTKPTLKQRLFDDVWKYQVYLRKCEYLKNTRKFLPLILNIRYVYCKHKLKKLGYKLGFSISENTIGKGLSIAHYGSIVVSPHARIGENCRIHVGVNIGMGARGEGAPKIGDNVYIGPGAKLFGDIEIGNNCVIGANAVVNKSFPAGVTLGGIPAKVISDKDSTGII